MHLFLHLCQLKQSNRYSAFDALSHPWVNQTTKIIPLTYDEETIMGWLNPITKALLFISLCCLMRKIKIFSLYPSTKKKASEQVVDQSEITRIFNKKVRKMNCGNERNKKSMAGCASFSKLPENLQDEDRKEDLEKPQRKLSDKTEGNDQSSKSNKTSKKRALGNRLSVPEKQDSNAKVLAMSSSPRTTSEKILYESQQKKKESTDAKAKTKKNQKDVANEKLSKPNK